MCVLLLFISQHLCGIITMICSSLNNVLVLILIVIIYLAVLVSLQFKKICDGIWLFFKSFGYNYCVVQYGFKQSIPNCL